MKIDYKSVITDYDGKPATDGKDKEITLGSIVIMALNTPTEKDKDLSADKKVHRAVISQDIHNAIKPEGKGFVDLPLEDITMIKDLITPLYPPLTILRVRELFDPKVDEVSKGKESK